MIKREYFFMKFDFEKYNDGNLYVVKEAKEKYVWDSEKREETDEYIGVQLLLEVRQDDYVHETNNGEMTGVSVGDEFILLVPDGKLEDYDDLVMRGFDAPKPVEVTKWDDIKFFNFKGKPADLKIMDGDVREYKKETPTDSLES